MWFQQIAQREKERKPVNSRRRGNMNERRSSRRRAGERVSE